MRNLIFIFVFTSLLLHGEKARCEPIKILGLNASMSKAQAMQTATDRGYSCNLQPYDEKWEQIVCEKGSENKITADVLLSSGQINSFSFSCGSTNTCGYSGDDIVDALKRSGVIPDSYNSNTTDGFKYIGPDGDRIVVFMGEIMLMRDKMGSSANFD